MFRKLLSSALLFVTAAFITVASSGGLADAAAAKTYQVTGPVLELTDTLITVQKGKEKWEIERTKDTKVTGDLKVGSKVTIEYRMSATTVEVKAEKGAAAKPDKAEKK
jgi:hypothetical protein